jgi:hypothetical protein
MSVRAIRRLWLLGAWLMLPWPMVIFGDIWVPAVRYTVLAGVACSVALAEGAAGPVLALVLLFSAWATVTTLGCWLFAWAVSKLMSLLPADVAGVVTLAILLMGLVAALALTPYETRFGTARMGGLLDILS